MLNIRHRRSSIDIIYEILCLLRLGATGKTEIMYTVNLSFHQIQKYLNRMIELGLIEKIQEDYELITYGATLKGLKLISVIESIQEMLKVKQPIDQFIKYEFQKPMVKEPQIPFRLKP